GTDPHQLGLTHRRSLEMQAAHDAAIDRQGVIFLDEGDVDAVLTQQLFPEDLGKEAARVLMANRSDLLDLGNLGGDDLHRASLAVSAELKSRRYRAKRGGREAA